jgi:hypothetical protein
VALLAGENLPRGGKLAMTTPNRHKYNKAAVDKAIKKDSTIKAREAKLIHRLLKGRKTSDEIYTKADRSE